MPVKLKYFLVYREPCLESIAQLDTSTRLPPRTHSRTAVALTASTTKTDTPVSMTSASFEKSRSRRCEKAVMGDIVMRPTQAHRCLAAVKSHSANSTAGMTSFEAVT